MKNLLIAFASMATMSCMAQTDIPAAVQAAFTKNFPGVTTQKWDKEDNTYEANFKKDGKAMSATFDANGGWMETETDIKVAELPALVVAYIKEHYSGATIKEAALIKRPGVDMYEAEVKGKDLLFDMQGKFIKEVAE